MKIDNVHSKIEKVNPQATKIGGQVNKVNVLKMGLNSKEIGIVLVDIQENEVEKIL